MSRLDLKCKCREVCPHDAAMTVWATPSAHRVFLYISSVTGTQEIVLDENGIRKLKFYPERCRRCGLCKEVCINSAINEEGGVDEIKKELVFCDKCGAVLTTRAHLFYIINKLKEKYYANQTLRRISAENMGIETRDLKLCPLCLMEEYKKVRAI